MTLQKLEISEAVVIIFICQSNPTEVQTLQVGKHKTQTAALKTQ